MTLVVAVLAIFRAESQKITGFTSPETVEDRACHNHTPEPLTTSDATLRPLALSFRCAQVPPKERTAGTN